MKAEILWFIPWEGYLVDPIVQILRENGVIGQEYLQHIVIKPNDCTPPNSIVISIDAVWDFFGHSVHLGKNSRVFFIEESVNLREKGKDNILVSAKPLNIPKPLTRGGRRI